MSEWAASAWYFWAAFCGGCCWHGTSASPPRNSVVGMGRLTISSLKHFGRYVAKQHSARGALIVTGLAPTNFRQMEHQANTFRRVYSVLAAKQGYAVTAESGGRQAYGAGLTRKRSANLNGGQAWLQASAQRFVNGVKSPTHGLQDDFILRSTGFFASTKKSFIFFLEMIDPLSTIYPCALMEAFNESTSIMELNSCPDDFADLRRNCEAAHVYEQKTLSTMRLNAKTRLDELTTAMNEDTKVKIF
jgi:hypothetical protein